MEVYSGFDLHANNTYIELRMKTAKGSCRNRLKTSRTSHARNKTRSHRVNSRLDNFTLQEARPDPKDDPKDYREENCNSVCLIFLLDRRSPGCPLGLPKTINGTFDSKIKGQTYFQLVAVLFSRKSIIRCFTRFCQM